MSDATVTLSDAALKIVKAEVRAFKADGERHVNYVNEAGVTLGTVVAHVAIFRDAFKTANPDATGDEVKAFATKIRNGLNRVLGKQSESATPTALLTSLGASSELEAVVAAWHAAQD